MDPCCLAVSSKALLANMVSSTAADFCPLANLFKGYAACSDKAFVRYIAEKQEDCEEDKIMNATKLMVLAENKFKILKTKEI
jgi:hypothetical protein